MATSDRWGGQSVRFSCQILSVFNMPKSLKSVDFWQGYSKKIKSGRFGYTVYCIYTIHIWGIGNLISQLPSNPLTDNSQNLRRRGIRRKCKWTFLKHNVHTLSLTAAFWFIGIVSAVISTVTELVCCWYTATCVVTSKLDFKACCTEIT